jgi:3D (Asp-Asp-Asp) domain-containing protein
MHKTLSGRSLMSLSPPFQRGIALVGKILGLWIAVGAGSGAIAAPLPWRLNPAAAPFASGQLQWFNLPRQGIWIQVNHFGVASRATPITLWATYYSIHRAWHKANGQPLLDPQGQPLGPTLSQEDWCYAALEGTVQVLAAGGWNALYTFAGRGDSPQVNCSPYFDSLSTSTLDRVNRVRFAPTRASYGQGTDGYRLVPYRTIAVDRTQIPLGSVIYIPEARGKAITLPSGDHVVHDGFFFAADVGSNIQGNHIDVFIGTSQQNPFPFISSRSSGTFRAFLIQDANISQALLALHGAR